MDKSQNTSEMVRLTCTVPGMAKTFSRLMRGKIYNHRKPIQYQRFKIGLNPDEIIAHYSRDDIDSINPRAGQRTFKDAQTTMGQTKFILPNLKKDDLEANNIFQEELDRQRAIVARIDKIRVIVDSIPFKGSELMMNKDISTPYDCASHLHDLLKTRSVVAEISSINEDNSSSETVGDKSEIDITKNRKTSTYWDMHRPLQESCRIKFRHFLEHDVGLVNKIYWRSCSFILGMAVRIAFKDDVKVLLHSWPKPDIKSGSFVYDVALNLTDTWQPSEQELRAFTKILWNIKNAELPFDRLEVNKQLAMEIFRNNPFKLSQIDSITQDGGKVVVYRCGGLVDISIGPMISNTSQIGRITLAAVHPFESDSTQFKGLFYRLQGVSLPQQLPLSSYVYQNIIINRAKELNRASL